MVAGFLTDWLGRFGLQTRPEAGFNAVFLLTIYEPLLVVAGLTGLPDLGAGWVYEGWAVDVSRSSPMPYSTGTFTLLLDNPFARDINAITLADHGSTIGSAIETVTHTYGGTPGNFDDVDVTADFNTGGLIDLNPFFNQFFNIPHKYIFFGFTQGNGFS